MNIPHKNFLVKALFADNDAKIEFEKHLVLTCDAPYVKCPKQFTLMHQEREFTISLDPVGLEAGVAHFAEVCCDCDSFFFCYVLLSRSLINGHVWYLSRIIEFLGLLGLVIRCDGS